MVFTTGSNLLQSADKNNYAQGAFNVNTASQIKALIEIHELMNAPLLIQAAELSMGFMSGRSDFQNSTFEDKKLGAENISSLVSKYGKDAKIPIALHLDHGTSFEVCKAAIDAGFTSVMIDGSSLPYEENIAVTKEVVNYAHSKGVSVEGELGVLAGVEDNIFSAESTYTNPLQAYDFIKRTEVDSLAISYGTSHGPNKGTDVKLRHEIVVAIKEILEHENISCSLVSHGSSSIPKYLVDKINSYGGEVTTSSGIPLEEINKAIDSGISKINVDSDIRLAVTKNLRKLYKENTEVSNNSKTSKIETLLDNKLTEIDPRVFLAPIMDSITKEENISSEVELINAAIENGVKEIVVQLIGNFRMINTAEYL